MPPRNFKIRIIALKSDLWVTDKIFLMIAFTSLPIVWPANTRKNTQMVNCTVSIYNYRAQVKSLNTGT